MYLFINKVFLQIGDITPSCCSRSASGGFGCPLRVSVSVQLLYFLLPSVVATIRSQLDGNISCYNYLWANRIKSSIKDFFFSKIVLFLCSLIHFLYIFYIFLLLCCLFN